MRYDIILFDADDTLFDFRRSERHAFAQTMTAFGFDYDEAYHLEVYQRVNTAIWEEFAQGRITQKALKVKRFRRLGEALARPDSAPIHTGGASVPRNDVQPAGFNPEAFAEAYETNLGNACFLLEGSEALVRRLRGTHRLGIVTNGLERVQSVRIAQSPIADCFETIIISESVGVAKPDPAIFDLTLARLGHTDRKSVLMVGDSLASDIRGGLNAGLDTCWYNPEGLAGRADIRPTYEIRSLEAVEDLVG